MNAKHTPEKFVIVEDDHQYTEVTGAAQLITTEGGDSVCLLIDTDDQDVCDARAKLLRAAPDLLAALESLLNDWRIAAARCPDLFDSDSGNVLAARAALAKAKGG